MSPAPPNGARARRWRCALALLTVPGVLVFAPAAPAAATTTVGDCAIQALTPATAVWSSQRSVKLSAARAAVDCSAAHTGSGNSVQVEVAMYGEDPFPLRDPSLGGTSVHNLSVVPRAGISAEAFVTGRSGSCNEDALSKDELYSKARIRISTNGVWSAWSGWDRGRTVSYACDRP